MTFREWDVRRNPYGQIDLIFLDYKRRSELIWGSGWLIAESSLGYVAGIRVLVYRQNGTRHPRSRRPISRH